MFNPCIAGIFEFSVVVAVLFDNGDSSFEVRDFSGGFDPVEVDGLQFDIGDVGRHICLYL